MFSQHCKASRDAGLSEEQVRAIPAWSVADCFSPIERAVLAYTDCLVLEGGRVPDAVFDALRAELNDTEILELTYITCTYDMHATMSRALRLEYVAPYFHVWPVNSIVASDGCPTRPTHLGRLHSQVTANAATMVTITTRHE